MRVRRADYRLGQEMKELELLFNCVQLINFLVLNNVMLIMCKFEKINTAEK